MESNKSPYNNNVKWEKEVKNLNETFIEEKHTTQIDTNKNPIAWDLFCIYWSIFNLLYDDWWRGTTANLVF